ncbi:glycosyltransferase family 2 protein [Plantactinospora sp. KBS50]|uniref:glycosyltransferase family 2 protein n=1 Tax=Plantactinospora sp. KBS50 TaxID=2024580 RepID=UPI0012FD3489|nr:glycosyltransferase family 2 protein [Plantactinospora sp. KBS50]
MPVSVVVPTVLRSPTLVRSVRSAVVAAQRCGTDSEVILVVNGAGGTPVPVAEGPGLRILHSAATGVSGARNDGVAAARHDTVLFVDDDLVVPPDWAARMAAALHQPGVTAVAAPVRTVALGPVTAYLEHDRGFDARPSGPGRAATLVTANAGYRRDALPGPPFDAGRYPRFGEDTDLGLRIRAAGGAIAWCDGGEPPLHEVVEEPASILRRTLRQGAGTARVYLQRRTLEYYLPAPLRTYLDLTAGRATGWRRFTEVADLGARAVFATIGLLRHAVLLVGYLDEIGRTCGVELVEPDEAGLIRDLGAVLTAAVDRAGVAEATWRHLPLRVGPPGTDPPSTDPPGAGPAGTGPGGTGPVAGSDRPHWPRSARSCTGTPRRCPARSCRPPRSGTTWPGWAGGTGCSRPSRRAARPTSRPASSSWRRPPARPASPSTRPCWPGRTASAPSNRSGPAVPARFGAGRGCRWCRYRPGPSRRQQQRQPQRR